MIIGTFEYNPTTDIYFGEVVFFDRKIHLKPAEKSRRDDPDYVVETSADFGVFEFGAGWKRRTKDGCAYVAIAIDAPMLPAPVHAALYLEEGAPFAMLVWQRTNAASKPTSP